MPFLPLQHHSSKHLNWDVIWQLRTSAAINWLRRSIEATGGEGSAHSWRPLLGWSKAYPETTGYIIPTLLDYALLHDDESLSRLAKSSADWLLRIQLTSGAFSGLLLGNTTPSVFNTSQILFGLARIAEQDPENVAVKKALLKAASWLMANLESDYVWKKHAFVSDFTPSYYTRAVWGLLCANEILQSPDIQERMKKSLNFYGKRFLTNDAIADWGFRPAEMAFTHTIAYTLEGFLECALVLDEADILSKTIASADQLLAVREQAGGRIAGRYDEQWQCDYSFVCLSGNAQLSVLYHRLYEITGDTKYHTAGFELLADILDSQKLEGALNCRGGIPGSKPFWGAYLPFRYPNWAAKFFLDAMAVYRINVTSPFKVS